MLRIGLTGGIASGKTTVADLFAGFGATVIDTDRIARDVVIPGAPALAALTRELGRGILDPDGNLDRHQLRERIFKDAATRRAVEGILHPAIISELIRQAQAAPGPYQVLVIPLLVEGGRRELVDRVLLVDCPEEMQIERLMSRDGETRGNAALALAAQATRAERLHAADDVIANDGNPAKLVELVAGLDRKYRRLAAKK
ncbi:MAG: dephospho-CoA kinase [Steroidobacteraceae bacterium]|nr:dephospho-CoA kinase [Steroidobacteraceae bacterium]